MNIFGAIFEGLKTIAGPVTTWIDGRNKLKQAQLDGKIAITQAKTTAAIEKVKTGQLADIQWEIKSIENAGWKDDYLLVLFSIPLVMAFIPGLVKYVHLGFAALGECPDWYVWSISIMVASAYGYKKIADFMGKKGNS